MLFRTSTVVLENEQAYDHKPRIRREKAAGIGLKGGNREQKSTKMWEHLQKTLDGTKPEKALDSGQNNFWEVITLPTCQAENTKAQVGEEIRKSTGVQSLFGAN